MFFSGTHRHDVLPITELEKSKKSITLTSKGAGEDVVKKRVVCWCIRGSVTPPSLYPHERYLLITDRDVTGANDLRGTGIVQATEAVAVVILAAAAKSTPVENWQATRRCLATLMRIAAVSMPPDAIVPLRSADPIFALSTTRCPTGSQLQTGSSS